MSILTTALATVEALRRRPRAPLKVLDTHRCAASRAPRPGKEGDNEDGRARHQPPGGGDRGDRR
eukprot:697279-Pyramimonas_sp.AAC.1